MPLDDDAFARFVQDNLLATPEQVGIARATQRESLDRGEPLALSEVLVRSGALTTDQRDEALRKLGEIPRAGETLGTYRLLQPIGAGGMGAVFLAEEQPEGRRVALKVLPADHARDQEALARFRQEAESAFQLNHPNIVRGTAAGEDRGFPYYAMEYCEGESLDRRLQREGALPWKEAVEISIQIAKALQYAHERGFVHRDLKPSNILLGRDGKAKLLDLGLTKRLVDLDRSFRTETGTVMGTPHYMAPEQAQGAKDADGRVDIYGLGATLYHLLTGRVPFPGSSIVEIIARHLEAERPDPREIRPDLPVGITLLLRTMMARQPEDRHRDVSELLVDLEAMLAGKLPQDRPRGQRSSAGRGRARLLKSLIAAVMIVVAVALPLSFWNSQPKAVARSVPSVDLLAFPDLLRGSIGAAWTFEKGALVSPARNRNVIHLLQIPVVPPVEYDLELVAQRLTGTESIDIGIVVDGHACSVVLDGWDGVACLHVIDGRDGANNETTIRETFFTDEKPRLVRCMVRRTRVTVSVDGRTIIDWNGDPRRFTSHTAYQAMDASKLFLAAWVPFRISRFSLTPRIDTPDPAASNAVQPAPIKPVSPPDPPSREPGREELLGHWSMDEGDGMIADDLSDKKRRALLRNGTTWCDGKLGKALRFNGKGDWVDVPNFSFASNAVTLAAWVRHESIPMTFQRYITVTPEVAVIREAFGGKLGFYVKLGTELFGFEIPNVLSVGEWIHVAGTWDGGTLRAYRNGREVARRRLTGVLAAGISLNLSSPGESMHGALDDVRIYGRALSPAEIVTLAGSSPIETVYRNPDPVVAAVTGLDYEYFEGTWDRLPAFNSLKPVATGIASVIDATPRKKETSFALRFSGLIEIPRDGTYTFYTNSDDGSKLLIGTSEVVQNDGPHGAQEAMGIIALKKGRHEISVIFYQGDGPHHLEVFWEGPDIPKAPVPAGVLFRPATRK